MVSPLGAFLCPPEFAGPTGVRALARESSAVLETARLLRRTTSSRLSRGVPRYAAPVFRTGDPVVLVPGFLAGDSSLMLLSRHLRAQGFRTYRSTMHANVGCTQEASYALERRIDAIALKRGRKVTIVGHSLGGLLARGIAARRPDLVEAIVTMGSPVLAPGAVHSVLAFDLAVVTMLRRAGLGRMMGEDCTSGDCARLSWEQSKAPLDSEIAYTSIFSRRDGVVDWRSCIDPSSRSIEVTTSHCGMAVDPVVFDRVTATLLANHSERVRSRNEATLPATVAAAAG